MATSGSFRYTMWSVFHGMNGVGTTYTNEVIFTWSVTSTISGPNPQSTISWTMTPEGRYDNVGARKYDMFVKIDGVQVGTGQFKFTNDISGSASGAFSGVTTLSHDANGVKSFVVEIGTTSYTGSSRSQSFTLDTLAVPATLTAAPNFTDEGDPMIYISNPSGDLVDALEACISFTGVTDDVSYRSIDKFAGTYRFYLTDAERKILRQGVTTGNSTTVRFYVRTTIGTTNYHSSIARTLTLVNYMPTLSPAVYDSNSSTTSLTGDPNVFVKYFSNARFNTGAIAKKEATIDNQYIICGSTTLEDYTSNTGVIEGVDSNTFYFGMTDSRGYVARDALVVDLIPYIKLTSSLTLQPLSLAGDLTFMISGNCYVGSFGAQDNDLQFQYQIKKDGVVVVPQPDGTWAEPSGEQSGWTNIVPTLVYQDNRYEATYSISGLDPNSIYTITAYTIDALMNVYSQDASVTSTPIFDWGKNDFKHNTSVYLTKNLSLRTVDNDGNDISILNPCNPQGALVLGWGQYDNANGDTSIYGNNINLTAKESVKINGTPIGGTVLWEGAYYMNASQVAQLSAPISEQVNGIVLVFSLYTDGSEEDVSINTFFVSKKEVELLPNAPHTFFMMINSGFSVMGAKYLYINDTAITGHATNSTAGTNNNMTYANNRFVLRYVIGV